MPAVVKGANWNWLCTGQDFFASMLAAIEEAKEWVCLETYVFSAGSLGDRFRERLVRARDRGLRIKVLLDALGSYLLPYDYWKPLVDLGGEVRYFNPLSLERLVIRNHRKLLVCDDQIAFVGGFNIAPEYEGDGITSGWRDLGLRIEGPLVHELAVSFEEMFAAASLAHRRFVRFRRSRSKRTVTAPGEQVLLSGPGRGRNPIKRALKRDFASARSVQIMVAYFLPTWQIRRELARVARSGGKVQLILAGKTDVEVSRAASQSLYRRLLKAGVEIYEYQPQVLHAKLFIFDKALYVGSSNLDPRSLNLNYELMIRFEDQQLNVQGREIFSSALRHCRRISLQEWWKSRTWWQRLKQRWAYLLLVRLDPYIARRQIRALPD